MAGTAQALCYSEVSDCVLEAPAWVAQWTLGMELDATACKLALAVLKSLVPREKGASMPDVERLQKTLLGLQIPSRNPQRTPFGQKEPSGLFLQADPAFKAVRPKNPKPWG